MHTHTQYNTIKLQRNMHLFYLNDPIHKWVGNILCHQNYFASLQFKSIQSKNNMGQILGERKKLLYG